MTLLAITAEQVALNGKAWVEAVAAIANALIAQIGILLLAAIAVYQNIRKQLPSEFTERLNRYNDRLDRVANMTVAAAPEEKKMEVAAAVARTPEVAPIIPVPPIEPPPSPEPKEVVVTNTEPISVTEAPKPKPLIE